MLASVLVSGQVQYPNNNQNFRQFWPSQNRNVQNRQTTNHSGQFSPTEYWKQQKAFFTEKAGLTEDENNDGAERIVRFAMGLMEDVAELNKNSAVPIRIRIGINSGELVAGVIGKTKFIYDIWGDNVNIASRMESTGRAGRIHVSESTYEQVKDIFTFKEKVEAEVKGKGIMTGFYL